MESEHEETLNKLIQLVSFGVLIIGATLIGWFFGDWAMVSNGAKQFIDIFDLTSIARLIVGMVCIIGYMFGRMIEKRKIESPPKRA